MPEYLSPGVYIQEVDTGTRPIEGVGTACAAFIGMAQEGPPNKPVLITNWTQYIETFGARDEKTGKRDPHMAGSYLSHSVYGYFLNGGGRCYVTRIVASNGASKNGKAAEPAQLQLPSRAANKAPSLTVKARATPSSDIEIEVQAPTGENPPEGSFTLRIRMAGADEEVFENVGLGRRAAKNVAETVNAASKLVMVEELGTGSLAERAPEIGTQTIRAQRQTQIEATVKMDDFAGDPSERSGLEGLQIAEDVTMVTCPDLMSAYQAGILDRAAVKAVQLKMIAHCELMGDRMAILDPLPDLSPQEVKAWRETETNYDSRYAVLYYPWIKVAGPGGVPMDVPPCGYMAGIWARNDNERGVHKAPANEVVRGALAPATPITKGEQDTLNPKGVNCIRSFTGRGVRVWGARTLSSDPAWRYINVRRLFNYVEKSIEQGTQWVVFEPNDEDLWARVRRDVAAFLTGAWREGMLFGASSGEAFFVKCDAELNPQDVRDRGQLFIDVGLAPVKPAEFVIFRLSQYAGGGA
jgi:Bacteriophage tail sheath protein